MARRAPDALVKTLTEFETLEAAHAGQSIARFGDGELKLAVGHDAVSQRAHPALKIRLQTILKHADRNALVCLPIAKPESPKVTHWRGYMRTYRDLWNPDATYGSAFITRPDSAPWIDTPDYWDRMAQLWRGRDVVLVRGSAKGFTPEDLKEARTVSEIMAPRQHAFEEFDALFRRLRGEKRRVLLCLGATATALAWALGGEGVHALDLGHVSMFMRRRGLLAA